MKMIGNATKKDELFSKKGVKLSEKLIRHNYFKLMGY
jgi:hypothetical protein